MPDKNRYLTLTPSQLSVLYDILDQIVKVYKYDPGHDSYTRSTTDFIAAFSKEEYSNILTMCNNLI